MFKFDIYKILLLRYFFFTTDLTRKHVFYLKIILLRYIECLFLYSKMAPFDICTEGLVRNAHIDF